MCDQRIGHDLPRRFGQPDDVAAAVLRERGYPDYARERVDPLAVLDLKAKRKPKIKRRPPADPPRLSDY